MTAIALTAAGPPEATISNGTISAKLYLPDAAKGYYQGTRFDWSGVIHSLQYMGHDYYGPWFDRKDPKVRDFVYEGSEIVVGPCSGITGPADDFRPLGYDTAKTGDTFVKIGIGALRKAEDGRYDAYKLLPIANGGKWTIRKHADSVEFIHTLNDAASGYGYVYRKTVKLIKGKPVMLLQHSIKNTGTKPIETTVYNHNFLVLDKQTPSEGLTISLPFPVKSPRPPNKDLAEIRGNQIVYRKSLTGRDVVTGPVQGFGETARDHEIRIENHKAGAGMVFRCDQPLSSAALWSIRSNVSMEPFIAISAQPGKEFSWTTTYEYYTLPSQQK
jgi:hypothetical protein